MSEYANPDTLVTTAWVAEHLNDPKVKIVEVDVEPAKGYDVGHVQNAIGWNWQTDLCDTTIRDLIDPQGVFGTVPRGGDHAGRHRHLLRRHEQLVRRVGAVAVQVSRPQRRPADERRAKEVGSWRSAPARRTAPTSAASNYPVPSSDESIRAYRDEVLKHARRRRTINLVDVRSPDEFTGKILAEPPGITKPPSAAGTSPARRTSPGPKPPTTTARSRSRRRAAEALRRRRRRFQQADDRLLPHRRALEPHVVRAEVSAGREQREELRRLVDRMGQSRRRADRDTAKAPPLAAVKC